MKALHNRGLITRQKQFNRNTSNSNTSHYYYSITDEGVALLVEKEKEPGFTALLDPLESFPARNNLELIKDSISIYLGKNQKTILRLFQDKKSFFLTDLKELTSLDKAILNSSLKWLFTRGILFRKKESNPYSGNHLKHFKYRNTELGKSIKVS